MVALCLAPPVAGAEVVTQRARAAIPLWAEGEVPEGHGSRGRDRRPAVAHCERPSPWPSPRRHAQVRRRAGPLSSTRTWRSRRWAKPADRLRYAARYRVTRDEGRGPAVGGDPETAEEYALEVEAQVDLSLVRKRLTETQLLLFEAPPPDREHQVIVLEGDFSYTSYTEIRRGPGRARASRSARTPSPRGGSGWSSIRRGPPRNSSPRSAAASAITSFSMPSGQQRGRPAGQGRRADPARSPRTCLLQRPDDLTNRAEIGIDPGTLEGFWHVAQWESTTLTRWGSAVQSRPCQPLERADTRNLRIEPPDNAPALMSDIQLTLPDGRTLGDAVGDALARGCKGNRSRARPCRGGRTHRRRTRRLARADPIETPTIEIVTTKDEAAGEVLRHSAEHVMADAVKRLFPSPSRSMSGAPTTAEKFQYDFLTERAFTPEDLEAIEADDGSHPQGKRELRAPGSDTGRSARAVSRDGRRAQGLASRGHPRRTAHHLVPPRGVRRPLPRTARATHRPDRGVHACSKSPAPIGGATSATQCSSGSTGQRSGRKKSSPRTSPPSRRRSVATIAAWARSSTSSTSTPVSPGSPFYHPKGVAIYNELVEFVRGLYPKYGYQEVITPQVVRADLYRTSGHYDLFHEDMFRFEGDEGRGALRQTDELSRVTAISSTSPNARTATCRFASPSFPGFTATSAPGPSPD